MEFQPNIDPDDQEWSVTTPSEDSERLANIDSGRAEQQAILDTAEYWGIDYGSLPRNEPQWIKEHLLLGKMTVSCLAMFAVNRLALLLARYLAIY